MTTAIPLFADTLARHTAHVVFGAEALTRSLAIALIARGHVLLEGAPGLGKTLLAKSLAQQLGGRYQRVQCTPDLMPADLTGIHVFRSASQTFELMPGPLFADVVLIDELNRTGPKTQSALLQAMEERKITIDRQTYALSEDFVVLATQNPHEFEGTFPLPESQLDRFLMRLRVPYPDAGVEARVLRAYDASDELRASALAALPALPAQLLHQARAELASVFVSEELYGYVAALAAASRRHGQITLGLSTRGALALMRCARIEAALQGSRFVTPDHVKAVAPAVIAHRLLLTADATLDGITPEQLVERLLASVPVPRGESANTATLAA